MIVWLWKLVGFLSCFPFALWEAMAEVDAQHGIVRSWPGRVAAFVVRIPLMWRAFSDGFDDRLDDGG